MAFSAKDVPMDVATAYEVFRVSQVFPAYSRQPYAVTFMGTGDPLIDNRGQVQFSERGSWRLYKVFSNRNGVPAEMFINVGPDASAVVLPKEMDFAAAYYDPRRNTVVPITEFYRKLRETAAQRPRRGFVTCGGGLRDCGGGHPLRTDPEG